MATLIPSIRTTLNLGLHDAPNNLHRPRGLSVKRCAHKLRALRPVFSRGAVPGIPADRTRRIYLQLHDDFRRVSVDRFITSEHHGERFSGALNPHPTTMSTLLSPWKSVNETAVTPTRTLHHIASPLRCLLAANPSGPTDPSNPVRRASGCGR